MTEREPLLPHQFFGDPECGGTLRGLERPDQPGTADIVCRECNAAIRTVPAADLRRTLVEMENTLAPETVECRLCGAVNLFPGFGAQMLTSKCRQCNERLYLAMG